MPKAFNDAYHLKEFLKLDDFAKEFPLPPRGHGGTAISLGGEFSQEAVMAACMSLSDEDLLRVLSYTPTVTAHNNAIHGHASSGGSFTMKRLLQNFGDEELRKRIKAMS